MKKIFLTSGIIVCMACPAFATGFNTDPYDADPQELTQPGACVYDVIGGEDGSTTLRAIWNAHVYNVTYNKGAHAADGVTDYTDTATYNEDYTALTAADTGLTAADGYTFVGYTTDSIPVVTRNSGSGAVNSGTVANEWTNQEPWTFTTDKTVYAAYLANQYTVSYSCGTAAELADGAALATGASASQVVTYDDAFTATGACEYTGHTFAGWNCGNNTLPDDGEDWNIAGDVSCTAVWNTNQIDITWDFDGATSTVTAETTVRCSYGSNVTLPATPTKAGYDFDGWEVVPEAAPASGGENSGNNNG